MTADEEIAIDIEFLNEAEKVIVNKIARENNFTNPEAFMRFWDNKTIQIDGDVNISELKVLVLMLEAFK